MSTGRDACCNPPQDPLLLRLTEHDTAEEAREMALKIAPELESVPADTGFDAPKLLQGERFTVPCLRI